jgi:Ca2+-binding RTX toxin-like protein
MMKRTVLTMALIFGVLTLAYFYSGADFIQCGAADCFGTTNADVMNGTADDQIIWGSDGGDVIFGGPGLDFLSGDEGNDVLFGGPGSDILESQSGNDTLLGGPDDLLAIQELIGDEGNENFLVFAGDTSNCLTIHDFSPTGKNVVNLIGFGPYSAVSPFGLPDFGDAYLIVQDPIAGGYVMMHLQVPSTGDGTVHEINGLISPNVSVVDEATADTFMTENCTTVTSVPQP